MCEPLDEAARATLSYPGSGSVVWPSAAVHFAARPGEFFRPTTVDPSGDTPRAASSGRTINAHSAGADWETIAQATSSERDFISRSYHELLWMLI
jgi:hypothetical protein